MDGRRDFLLAAGALAMAAGSCRGRDFARAPAGRSPAINIRFAVCGISHDHIHGMIGAIQRGGGELVAWWGAEPDKRATFLRRYPDARAARSQDEILQELRQPIVLSSHIASERAGIGVRAMQAGKDFLADKPGITTLEDLALVRKTIAEPGANLPSSIPSGWK